jgi:hypothetical protein
VSRRRALTLALSVALATSALGGFFVYRTSASPRMMHVGGHTNACACTQRIEP